MRIQFKHIPVKHALGFVPCLAVLLGGCASQVYQRETLVLQGPDLDQYSIRYEDFEGCLVRQQTPAVYGLARPQYALVLRMIAASEGSQPAVEVVLKGSSTLHARFPGLEPQPTGSESLEGSRYRVEVSRLSVPVLDVQVYQEERLLRTERVGLERRSCKAYGWG